MSDDHDRIDPEPHPQPHPQPDPADALARALRAPGTPSELAAREDYLAMFRVERHHQPVAPARRPHLIRRFGAGTALAAVLALGGGGVAAAYAGSLPEPLQRAAHRVLGPLGAPPAKPDRPIRAKSTPSPRATPETAAPSPSPSGRPSTPPGSPGGRGGAQPSKEPKPTPSPSASPSGTPTEEPSGLPTSPGADPTASPTVVVPTTAPVLRPGKVNIRPTAKRVDAGATAVFFGTVTGSGKRPVPLEAVFLEQRGSGGWQRVAGTTSDEDGDVTLSSPPLDQSSLFRLSAGKAHSNPYRILMVPVLTTSANQSGPSTTVSLTARGGYEGDAVTVTARAKGRTTVVSRGRLDSDGTVSLALEQRTVPTTYVVTLRSTSQHTEARTTVALPASEGGG